MRIALVSQEYPPETAHGGIGSQTWNKAHSLRALGHEVHVVSASGRGAEERTEITDAGITVSRITPPGEERDGSIDVNDAGVYEAAYSWLVCRFLNRLEKTEPFDVIDFADYGAEGFAYLLNRRSWRYTPVVIQLHGPLAMFAERYGWPARNSNHHEVGIFLEGLCLRRADRLMSCSENIADFTAGYYHIPRETIDVVHCGVDAINFRPPEVSNGSHPTVLFVGNLNSSKGIHVVTEAVLKLRSRHPQLKLQIAGRGEEALLNRLRNLAAEAGASDALQFVGYVRNREDLVRLYQKAALFCSPAHHEVGVANVYIEAMSCACPVVAATTGAAREAIIDGETGFLVPPNDSQSTADAIDRLLTDSGLRRRFGESGRRRVENYFAMDKYIDRVLETYERASDAKTVS